MPSFVNPKAFKNAFGEHPTVSVDDSWPDAGLVARKNDAQGQAILDYQKKWSSHPDFPASPWDTRRGEIYLPDLDQRRPATDEKPFYRLKEDAYLGCVLYRARDEIKYTAWPVRPYELEAMNESASLVLSYQQRHSAGRTLPGQPWVNGVLDLPNPAMMTGSPVWPKARWA